jgi:hypothetical protein
MARILKKQLCLVLQMVLFKLKLSTWIKFVRNSPTLNDCVKLVWTRNTSPEQILLAKFARNVPVSLSTDLVAPSNVRALCQDIKGVDLSYNLIPSWDIVARIAIELPSLERLAMKYVLVIFGVSCTLFMAVVSATTAYGHFPTPSLEALFHTSQNCS